MISIAEAERRILAPLFPLPEELVPLPQSWNRVLARPLASRTDNPPADVSAMDGYAVRAADAVPGRPLRLVGEAAAGHPFPGSCGPGECVRIFTGSVIPPGADTVLIQEHAAADGATVRPTEPVDPGRHIRRHGQDFAIGSPLAAAGRRLGARDIGLLAAGNHAWIPVRRVPRVLLVATGDEVVLPGEPAPPGSIFNSNSPMLAALVRAAGGEPLVSPPVPDDPAAIRRAIGTASGIDLIVTVGGVSVGDHDLVKSTLSELGFDTGFWKIAMRPGKPLLFGTVRTGGTAGTPLLGLPGNPVSAAICALRFLFPALRRLGGEPDAGPDAATALLSTPLPANDGRADHLRATLAPGADALLVTPLPRQDSGMLGDLVGADALILRPPHAPPAAAGTPVPILRLDRLGL